MFVCYPQQQQQQNEKLFILILENENISNDTTNSTNDGQNDPKTTTATTRQQENTDETERRDESSVEDAEKEQEEEDATTTNNHSVNKRSAVSNAELGETEADEPIVEVDETYSLLLTSNSPPVGNVIKTSSGRDDGDDPSHVNTLDDANDEESTLITTAFERPYSTPLAPLDMELIERLQKEQDEKRYSRSASNEHKRHSSHTPSQPHRSGLNAALATAKFMEHESLTPDAIADSQEQREQQLSGGRHRELERVTALHLNNNNGDMAAAAAAGVVGSDSEQQPSTTMTNLDEW